MPNLNITSACLLLPLEPVELLYLFTYTQTTGSTLRRKWYVYILFTLYTYLLYAIFRRNVAIFLCYWFCYAMISHVTFAITNWVIWINYFSIEFPNWIYNSYPHYNNILCYAQFYNASQHLSISRWGIFHIYL